MARDIYQEVTDRIVEALEQGTVPWQRPWQLTDPGNPRNGNTGREYSGINVLLLWLTAQERGYSSNEWHTYRGAQKAGGHVRKGETGTLVTFYKTIIVEEEAADGGVEKKRIPLLRHFVVFNREQIDGLPEVEPIEHDPIETDAAAEAYAAGTGAAIHHGGGQAFYSGQTDRITVPPREVFDDGAAYHSTVFHELTHWTGSPQRLDRELFNAFGSPEYAAEELVAEMGAAFLTARFSLQGHTQHPEYIANWIQVLKNDKKAVVHASSQARQAVEYMDSLQAATMAAA